MLSPNFCKTDLQGCFTSKYSLVCNEIMVIRDETMYMSQ